uniref:Uncharacterized protein n=1 Tax=Lepisosteus oculatus TaxID=7918 RepID=W5MZA7_LEPOC
MCGQGFVGRSCELGLHDNDGAGRWYEVSQGDPDLPPRTAASGVYLGATGALYLFGGFDLNSALGDLVCYNFTTNLWAQRTQPYQPVRQR